VSRDSIVSRDMWNLQFLIISLNHAKRAFYRAANAIFDNMAVAASEEIVLQVIKSKC